MYAVLLDNKDCMFRGQQVLGLYAIKVDACMVDYGYLGNLLQLYVAHFFKYASIYVGLHSKTMTYCFVPYLCQLFRRQHVGQAEILICFLSK